ncbi:P-loop containing nucleoside triphosphate hydrolase protein [Jimgerdemannia flammicorona]|uniref:P-loop containing nucleoside triphosphate hydrolase protein n=2 Tax=Jimgerdemannia flammicorona TaxID=994334 RepID=A0A433D5B2_9FUNG|nr:P-loop containing nucleoside triphosphate hydrolase protein [Jimgerdemannia flammicorona]RUS30679.1 P-loop containing nucleoside triphosphate hydrolase protein [Jimgerdemannia flammicorona]
MTSTAVRVALRVRPLTSKEQMSSCSECITFIPDEPQILIGTDRSFTFDYVFSPDSPQRDLYEQSVDPLLKSFVEGQTGSGKTYSMGTGLDGNLNSENQGTIVVK